MPKHPSAALSFGVVSMISILGIFSADSAVADDAYLAGYVAAVIERDFSLEVVSVRVSDATAYVALRTVTRESPERVARAVVRIDGIERAEIRVPDRETFAWTARQEAAAGQPTWELLPRTELFDPLLADPRQPHFSASYLWYLGDPRLDHVGNASFGETFAIVGGPVGDGDARWEVGLLAGVFSIFDLDAPSTDLVNADYWVAPTVSFRLDALSAQLRLYHQSSHLGDEFLLRNRTDRVNLSYEGIDLILSADLHPHARLYFGGGTIVRDDPELDPWSAQVGLELESPWAMYRGMLRPIAAVDFQVREQNDWVDEVAAVAGLQFENPSFTQLRIQLVFEYFRGNSPNGQFFERQIEYLGAGAHFHF